MTTPKVEPTAMSETLAHDSCRQIEVAGMIVDIMHLEYKNMFHMAVTQV